jgi:hypothetical protein
MLVVGSNEPFKTQSRQQRKATPSSDAQSVLPLDAVDPSKTLRFLSSSLKPLCPTKCQG